MLLEQEVEKYLQYCKAQKELNDKTIRAYRADLGQFISFVDEHGKEISKNVMNLYLSHIHEKYKQKTVKRKIASVKALFRYLEEEEVIEVNPFYKVKTKFKEEIVLPKIIPRNIIEELLDYLYQEEQSDTISKWDRKLILRDIAVIEMLFATGLRISELCGLQDKAFDSKNGVLYIRGKGGKERYLQIGNSDVLDILNKYKQNFGDAITISMMSDFGIHFFCVYRGINKKQKMPDYEITYLHNGETKHEIIHNISISLENIVRIPLTGKKVNEFIGIQWSEIIDLIKRSYCQILMIHGKSGIGKTRLVEEIISISKQNNFSTKFFDCKNKNGATILKNILSFILEVPFDSNSLKEDIKQIIENEYGKQEYTDYLYELFTNNKLNEDAIFYITRLLTHFVENPRFENPHILFIDNIQECEVYLQNLLIKCNIFHLLLQLYFLLIQK